MSDGKVVFDITGDTGGLDSSLNKATNAIKNHTNKWDNMMSQVGDGLKQAFSFSVGQLVADGVQQALGAIRQFANESIEMASSLEEVQNVVDTPSAATPRASTPGPRTPRSPSAWVSWPRRSIPAPWALC